MKTSVVISSYNGAQYIEQQLESIRKQTLPVDEVLVFDDCSSDNTVGVVNNFIKINALDGWHIYVNKANKGWRRNFIDGMSKTTGDIVFTCDQDDIWRSDKVETMVNIMKKNTNIKVLASIYKEFFEDRTTNIGPIRKNKNLIKVELYNNYMLNKLPGCTFAMRQEIVQYCQKYWQNDFPHDALIWRLGLFSDSLYVYTDDLIEWRKHKTSAFATEIRDLKNKKNKYSWILTAIKMNDAMRAFVKNDVQNSTKKEIKLLEKTAYYLSLRKKLYDTNNPIYAIRLARYWNLYPRYRQYLADWYLVYVKR